MGFKIVSFCLVVMKTQRWDRNKNVLVSVKESRSRNQSSSEAPPKSVVLHSPLRLCGYFEVVVGGVAPLLVPVLQLYTKLVLARRRERVQCRVAQPVFPLRIAKAFPVFLPCPVEVH